MAKRQSLGIPVPLYHDDEEYYPDEPSLAAIRFLVWHAANEMTDNVYHADTPRIWKMAQAAYDLLDEEFEQASINEQLVSETHARLGLASMNFDSLRTTLKWLYRSYLIRCPDNPFYDPEYAKEEVDEMLHDTSVSTALMQYLLRNNFLPDLNGSTLFCHTATASEKNSDTQFYLRYLRQEKY